MSAAPGRPTLEIAAFDPVSALAAAAAGADRLELCRDAAAGGLTPPLAWVEEAAQAGVPVVAMVRPHARGWTFAAGEHAAMRAEAAAALAAGAAAVAWGALRPAGDFDADALRRLADAVGPDRVVVHRAFDHARDLDRALDALLAAGVARVLTGGGPGPALGNADRLARLVRRAGDALTVLPGGGVRAATVAELVRRTGALEVHSGARAPDGTVDPGEVRRLRAALDGRPAPR